MVHLSSITEPKDTQADNRAAHGDDQVLNTTTIYGSKFAAMELPKHVMPAEEMPPRVAYKLIADELALDGNPFLNLASFVTTYMEPEVEKLMTDAFNKNFIDYEEYPATCDLQNRCVSMIGHLFNVPVNNKGEEPLGVSTVGSSEAIMLGVLAMKKRWQNVRKAAGKDWHSPNIVMGSNVQVCWEKAARYFEIEEKYVYCTESRYVLDPKEAVDLVDENTIGVCVILGSTFTGEYEDVKTVDSLLRKKNEEMGWSCPIHVDAASGGFVAPFVYPELEWDFRLQTVVSINTSGHKYGLTYPGIGWAIWRAPEFLPKELIFNINYLGADQASFTLNFSKGASQIIGQYYQLIRLGFSGYRAIMKNLTDDAIYLTSALEKSGSWTIMSAKGKYGLPLVAFRLSKKQAFDEFDVAKELRQRQWVVPAYTMAPHAQSLKLLRIVLREDFTRSRCDLFVRDLAASLDHLETLDKGAIEAHREAFQKRADGGRVKHERKGGADKIGGKHAHSLQGKFGKSHNVC